MRKTHIDYLRTMVESVSLSGQQIFSSNPTQKQGKFLETYPPLDLFQRILPICVINSVRVNDNLDSRYTIENRRKVIERLPDKIDTYGNRILRTLQEEFKQEFRYVLHFVVKDPSKDILSNVNERGILDQCKIYISQNPKFLSKVEENSNIGYFVSVDVVSSELITQFATDGIYILSLEILFRDKLFTISEEPALKGTLQIEQPIGIETIL